MVPFTGFGCAALGRQVVPRDAALEERHGSARLVLESDALPAGADPVLPEPPPDRFEEHGLEVAAVHRVLRPVVSGRPSERLAKDELAEPVEENRLPRLHRDARQLRVEPEPGQLLHRVRQEVDADPDRLDLGRRLEHPGGDAGLLEGEGQGQPADPAADDQHFHGPPPKRLIAIRPRGRQRPSVDGRAPGR